MELFARKAFSDILEIFSLEMGHISSDLLKKAFATWQYAFLSATSTTFYDSFGNMRTKQNFEIQELLDEKVTNVLMPFFF